PLELTFNRFFRVEEELTSGNGCIERTLVATPLSLDNSLMRVDYLRDVRCTFRLNGGDLGLGPVHHTNIDGGHDTTSLVEPITLAAIHFSISHARYLTERPHLT